MANNTPSPRAYDLDAELGRRSTTIPTPPASFVHENESGVHGKAGILPPPPDSHVTAVESESRRSFETLPPSADATDEASLDAVMAKVREGTFGLVESLPGDDELTNPGVDYLNLLEHDTLTPPRPADTEPLPVALKKEPKRTPSGTMSFDLNDPALED